MLKKRFLYSLMLSFFFFSCSSDSEIIEEDPIAIVNYYSSGKLVENNNISAWFDRSLDVYSIRLHAAGAVGGQLAVPDEWIKKTAQTFKLLMDKNTTGINENDQLNMLKVLKGEIGDRKSVV